MKKKLLAMALALLSLPIAAQAQSSSGVVTSDPSNGTDQLPIRTECGYSLSETLYTAAEMGTATNNADSYTINELFYPAYTTTMPAGTSEVKVFLKKADNSVTALESRPDISEFTEVLSGTVSLSTEPEKGLRLVLDKPYAMSKGEGLYVALWSKNDYNESKVKFQSYSADTRRTYYTSDYFTPIDLADLSSNFFEPANTAVGLTITYTAGGGEPAAETKTGVVTSDPSNGTDQLPIRTECGYSLSETLYTAAEMGTATNNADSYTINELFYPAYTTTMPAGTSEVKVFLKKADNSVTALESRPDISEFTEVLSGTVSLSTEPEKGLRLVLDKPYAMSKGEGLYVALWSKNDYNESKVKFQSYSADTRRTYYTSDYYTLIDLADLSSNFFESANTAVGLTITYTAGGEEPTPEPDPYVDLAISEFTGSTKVSVGASGSYEIVLKNEGTKTASGYTVEVYNVDTNAALATITDGKDIFPGFFNTLTTTVQFDTEGTYTLGARVIAVDDTEASNNVSAETIKVTVVDKGFLPNALTMTLPNADGTAYSANTLFNRDWNYSGSQVMLKNQYFAGMTQDLQLQKLGLRVVNYSGQAQVPLKISLAQAEPGREALAALADLVPAEDFTEVFNGNMEIVVDPTSEYTVCWVEFDTPYVLEKDKDLFINVSTTGYDGCPNPGFRAATLDYKSMIYYRGSEECDVYSSSAKRYTQATIPLFEFQYALVPLPDVVDLQASALTLPEAVTANEAATYKVEVKNAGTVPVEEFSVELLDMTDEANPEVLVSKDFERQLPVDATTIANVSYTFEKEGTYKIAARVTMTGDRIADNNTTAVAEVTVAEAATVDLQAAALTLPEAAKAQEAATFSVEVKNVGNTAVESYTVELLNMADEAAPAVLATKEVTEALAAETSATVELSYTFAEAGEYKLAARVNAEGDAVADNNATATATLNVAAADVTDLQAIALILPADVKATEEAAYKVDVKNVGNMPVAKYTVELLDMTDEAAPKALASKEVTEALAADATATVEFGYAFAEAGTYKLAARVTAAGDADADNDTTAVATMTIGEKDGISYITVDGMNMGYNAGKLTVTGATSIAVYDLSGRVIASAQGDTVNASLANGIYIIVATTPEGVLSTKFNVK
ncbi:MAG: T9SS type A sorting domain-containing protein [Prevotella sp.]|nr:T9SS type A sorting domain-containing protein [Prevotella sp.]MCM1074862.1 T9SS type A sorting domain-containing protein [Ruminococcus sp.]